jgi:uncharacterized membrane protein
MSTQSIRTRLCALAGALVAAVALAAPLSSRAAYVLTEVSIAGATETTLWDINNNGTIVGGAFGTSSFGFILTSEGDVTTLTGPAGAASTVAVGISDTGVVVGSFALATDGPQQGFIYSGGNYTTFTVAGATETFLRGISPDARYLSGYYGTETVGGIAFVYDTLLGSFNIISPPDSLISIAQGINSAGVVVGSDLLSGPPLTRPGFMYDIGTGTRTEVSLAGATRTALRSIDDAGTLAGFFTDATGIHGFVGSPTSFEQIDFTGAVSTFVEGSNNAGWLVGQWLDADGGAHGFIAMQVPEPGSLGLMLVALAALGWVVRRRPAH